MTLPEQSDRAVAQTREFLVRLASPYGENGIKGIRREVRAEALALLRHYPYVWLSQYGDCPESDNGANADNTPAANATPTEGSVQNGCTLTDAEREAVAYFSEWCIGPSKRLKRYKDTLRGLLERLGGER